jgi:hypothetical protein
MLFLILVCVHVYTGQLDISCSKLLCGICVGTCVYWTPVSVVLNSGTFTCVYWTPLSVVLISGVCILYIGHLYQYF